MSIRGETARRRVAYGKNPDREGFFLIRSECVPPRWQNCCKLTEWKMRDVPDEDLASRLAAAWLAECPSKKENTK
jgi:hypothetical protein